MSGIFLGYIWLFWPFYDCSHPERFLVRKQDLILRWNFSLHPQLPQSFETRTFVFISKKLRLFPLLRMKFQFLCSYKSKQFVRHPCLLHFFSRRNHRISLYESLNVCWFLKVWPVFFLHLTWWFTSWTISINLLVLFRYGLMRNLKQLNNYTHTFSLTMKRKNPNFVCLPTY